MQLVIVARTRKSALKALVLKSVFKSTFFGLLVFISNNGEDECEIICLICSKMISAFSKHFVSK